MASSRYSSNGPDAKDVAEALDAFQQQNKVRIVITTRLVEENNQVDLWLEGKALSAESVNGVRSLLASANVRCLGSRHKTTDAATLALLYALDFQLALAEYKSADKKG